MPTFLSSNSFDIEGNIPKEVNFSSKGTDPHTVFSNKEQGTDPIPLCYCKLLDYRNVSDRYLKVIRVGIVYWLIVFANLEEVGAPVYIY